MRLWVTGDSDMPDIADIVYFSIGVTPLASTFVSSTSVSAVDATVSVSGAYGSSIRNPSIVILASCCRRTVNCVFSVLSFRRL